ncbi:hypothetical protein EVAR_46549_1 [Eumeta japonica]|uniref:Uncharacterized protein n=1 Tax=Eumeta variegata TaxID=151549 RepID=A0A4C1XNB1_EUMVA|nr:hypothetical protein EVAR_46549_1 [Eumeta japonica]
MVRRRGGGGGMVENLTRHLQQRPYRCSRYASIAVRAVWRPARRRPGTRTAGGTPRTGESRRWRLPNGDFYLRLLECITPFSRRVLTVDRSHIRHPMDGTGYRPRDLLSAWGVATDAVLGPATSRT